MPDLVTHVTVNFLLGKITRSRKFLPIFILGSMLPDLLSRAPTIIWDRLGSITTPFHSIFGLLITSYLIAMFFPEKNRKKIFVWLFWGCMIHLVLDSLQRHVGVGLFLFFPFSWFNYRWGLFWSDDSLLVAIPLIIICAVVIATEKFLAIRRNL